LVAKLTGERLPVEREATLAVAERGSSTVWVRVVTAVLLALAVAAPIAAIAIWGSEDTVDDRQFAEGERRGVEYLQPLTKLLGVLIASQSAAVRGDQIETAALETELAAVERVEARHGAALSTRSRWPTLRDSIKELSERPGAPGNEAYQRWGQAVDLTVALIRRVGDTSRLILDPELDTYYLMDAGMIRLPEVAQAAGQLSDLAVINRGLKADDARASVLRDRIATNAAAVATGLGKVVDSTSSGRVGSAILSPLDQFGAATDALAPSVAVAVMPPLPDNLAAASVGVRDASQRLSQTVWTELDRILTDRVDFYSVRRIKIYSAAALGLLVAVLVGVVFWVRRRPERATASGPTDEFPSTGRHSSPGTEPPPGQPYPAYTDPAVSAIVGSPRAPAGVR
jgi:hypothetical protein